MNLGKPKLTTFTTIINYGIKILSKNENLEHQIQINEIGSYKLDLIPLKYLKQEQQGKISYIRGIHKEIKRLK